MRTLFFVIFIHFFFSTPLLAQAPPPDILPSCQNLDPTSLYLIYQQNIKNNEMLFRDESLDDLFILQINDNLSFKLEIFTSALNNKIFLDSKAENIECMLSEYLEIMTVFFQDGNFMLPSYQKTFFDIVNNVQGLKQDKLDLLLVQSFIKIIEMHYTSDKLLSPLQDLLFKIPSKLLDQIIPQAKTINTLIANIPIEDRYELINKKIITQPDLVKIITNTSEFGNYSSDFIISEKITRPFFRNKYPLQSISILNSMLKNPLKISDVQNIFTQFDIPTLLMLDSLDLKWRCSIGEKILTPFEIYNYSSEAMSLLNQMTLINLDCIKSKLNEKKIFSSSDYQYFNKWCNETKDFDLCTKYFSSEWISKLQRCDNNQDCIKVNPNKNQTFYYNSKNKGDDLLLFLKKYNFFIEEDIFSYSISAPSLCVQNSCRPNFSHCNPDKLFNEIILNLQSSELNKCSNDNDCTLKEFSFPGIWRSYVIGLNNELAPKNHKNTELLFNQALNKCEQNIGNMYLNIRPGQTKNNLRPLCIKNFCNQVPLY